MEFSSVFLKLIIIYIITESLVGLHCLTTLHIRKSKTSGKTTETAFHKCSANRCSVKLSKIHWKVPMLESHLNIVARLQPATL